MTCPFCQNRFDAPAPARCPECGCEVMRLTSGLVKTSAVLIAAEDKRSVYRSVKEVPEALRRRLVESTQGLNSATIVIADHGGREHMQKSLEREGDRTTARADAPSAGGPEPDGEIAPANHSDAPSLSRMRLLSIGAAAAALAGLAAWMLHGLQW